MSYHGRLPIVPLRTLARVFMFEPGHPRVPPEARYVRQVRRENGTLVLDYFDAEKKKIGRGTARWVQTGPISPNFKTQPWWTKTAYWGPIVTPESEVGPVPMATPPSLGVDPRRRAARPRHFGV